MFSRIDDFVKTYTDECKITLSVLQALKDEALGQPKTPGDWTAGFTAWHIAGSACDMVNQSGAGITVTPQPEPLTVAAIVDEHKRSSAATLEFAIAKWNDADLPVPTEWYGWSMPLGDWLSCVVAHEIHHRGQLSVLMRQAGLTVPSIYGPNKEETAEYEAKAKAEQAG